jgi:hypothetical protein
VLIILTLVILAAVAAAAATAWARLGRGDTEAASRLVKSVKICGIRQGKGPAGLSK